MGMVPFLRILLKPSSSFALCAKISVAFSITVFPLLYPFFTHVSKH